MDAKRWVSGNTIFLTLGGSRLYGTSRPDSDYDYYGVALDHPLKLLGYKNFEQLELHGDECDIVIYAVSKFVSLCMKNNPTILDVLFSPRDAWVYATPEWDVIANNRYKFLHTGLINSYTGYAHSQIKRLEGHHKWLVSPPEKPQFADYNLALVSNDSGGQHLVGDNEALAQYKRAAKKYKEYTTWVTNRNEKRAALEARYGYDIKHAAHAIRLLLQLHTLLLHGDYNPRLSGYELSLVRSILNGEWRYEDLLSLARAKRDSAHEINIALRKKRSDTFTKDILIELGAISLSRSAGFTKAYSKWR